MTTSELQLALNEAGIDPACYSLSGGLPIEAYTLSHEPRGEWATYYSERGCRTGLRKFETEDAACRHFLAVVLADLTTRRR